MASEKRRGKTEFSRGIMIEDTELIKLPELPVIEIVDDLIQVYKEFMVIRAALQLKLFDWMAANGSATVEEISAGTGVKEEYISALMGMLFYLDIVRKSGEKYLVSPSANLHFVSTSNYYQGDVILAVASPQSPWHDLKSYLTNPDGKNTFDIDSPDMMASRAEQEVRGMIKNITMVISRWAGFKEAGSLLEIGSGHGLYAIAACQLHPTIHASVLVKPGFTDLLDQNSKRYAMSERVTPVIEELGSLPKGNKYDVILVSHALYADQQRLGEIISDVSNHLNDGGLFISNNWFIRD